MRASFGKESKELVRLALPLAFANFGQTLIGAVDTAVVGRVGARELGATGLGNSVFFTVTVVGMGIMLGLDPLIAQAVGARERARARNALWQGVWLAVALGLPLSAAAAFLAGCLEGFGIVAPTAALAQDYVWARLPGLVPFLLFVAARSYLQAVELTRPMVIGVILANVINLPLSWLLVFGDEALGRVGISGLGIPALGVAGAAWASTAADSCPAGRADRGHPKSVGS